MRSRLHSLVCTAAIVSACLSIAAQQPSAPNLGTKSPEEGGAYSYLYKFQAGCGIGASTSTVSTVPAGMCGVGMTIIPFLVTEFGVVAPQANRSDFSSYMSNDFVVPIAPKPTAHWAGHPVVLGGYTRMFETGHALDFGAGYEYHLSEARSLQFELRDYYTFANPNQHNVFLRAVWILGVPD